MKKNVLLKKGSEWLCLSVIQELYALISVLIYRDNYGNKQFEI